MADDKYICFVIAPIGDDNSDTRKRYNDLIRFIKHTLNSQNLPSFEVQGGLDFVNTDTIREKVSTHIRDASLCIADLSGKNENVYYEVGLCHAFCKPILFITSDNNLEVAADLRGIEVPKYDLSTISQFWESAEELRRRVESKLPDITRKKVNLNNPVSTLTLTDISRQLNSLEQKINQFVDRSRTALTSNQSLLSGEDNPFKDAKPVEVFAIAARDRDVQLMDSVLDRLRYNTDEVSFLDRYASVAASMGSDKGGAQLLERALWFTENSSISFRMKIEYLGCLVSYLNRKDLEFVNKDLIEKMCEILKSLSAGQPDKDVAQIYNQLNRLYHGIYTQQADDPKWVQMAIENLETAKRYVPQESYVYFNLATCYHNLEDYTSAKENIMSAIELDSSEPDEDHLFLACRILSDMGEKDTDEYNTVLTQLSAISPVKARLIDLMK